MNNNYPINADPRPKRYKDKDNPCTIYSIGKDTDHPKYFVEFNDGEGVHHCLEITKELYLDFDTSELADISYKNENSRHRIKENLSDEEIHRRSAGKEDPLQDIIEAADDNARLHKAILMLPLVQQRRVIMYYFQEMTYERIASIENCSIQAIEKTLRKARIGIMNFLKTI